jgi:hypothetical protein
MLTIFFDSRGVVHHEYAPKGQNINNEYYLKSLVAFVMLCGARDQT